MGEEKERWDDKERENQAEGDRGQERLKLGHLLMDSSRMAKYVMPGKEIKKKRSY